MLSFGASDRGAAAKGARINAVILLSWVLSSCGIDAGGPSLPVVTIEMRVAESSRAILLRTLRGYAAERDFRYGARTSDQSIQFELQRPDLRIYGANVLRDNTSGDVTFTDGRPNVSLRFDPVSFEVFFYAATEPNGPPIPEGAIAEFVRTVDAIDGVEVLFERSDLPVDP